MSIIAQRTETIVPPSITSDDQRYPSSTRAQLTVLEDSRENAVTTTPVRLSPRRRWFLLFVFSVAQYLDVASYSGLFIFTERMARDLDIVYEASTWVITAYSVTFASFLLFWGRVSDLYSAKPVFVFGFAGLGITNLVISFLPEQFSFFVFRAISGIFGAATIPSAFRLICAIFEKEELSVALTLFGLSSALANATGLVLGGFFGFITAEGQMANWRWFFRMTTIVIVPFCISAQFLVPGTRSDPAHKDGATSERWRRLDIVGCFLMLITIILLILGLTLGAAYGFKTARFLVPFLLSWPLLAGFFVWESRLPHGSALIPPSFWCIPNMKLLIVFALGIIPWWAVSQLPLVERFQVVFGETPIVAAVRMLPQGLAALFIAPVIPPMLDKAGSPRGLISVGTALGAIAYILFVYSEGKIQHNSYWRWYFPSFLFGSAANMAAFLSVNITVMTSVPPEASGVAGAILQVALQVGAVIGLSVQAGMLTIHPGTFTDYRNVQASFWFQFGWLILNAMGFLALFRKQGQAPKSEA